MDNTQKFWDDAAKHMIAFVKLENAKLNDPDDLLKAILKKYGRDYQEKEYKTVYSLAKTLKYSEASSASNSHGARTVALRFSDGEIISVSDNSDNRKGYNPDPVLAYRISNQ